jgi:hypothetical protein
MSIVSQARNALGKARGYSGCYRCGGTWDYTEDHITTYDESQGCFPLCETCWLGLGTPEARMPYYEALRDRWIQGAAERGDWIHLQKIRDEWPLIRAAVEAGK